MNKWKELNDSGKASEIISAMVEGMDLINYLIEKSGCRPDQFGYQVHIYPSSISLYDDGFEFASCNIEGFKNPADFMSWVLLAISGYYYDVKGEEEDAY